MSSFTKLACLTGHLVTGRQPAPPPGRGAHHHLLFGAPQLNSAAGHSPHACPGVALGGRSNTAVQVCPAASFEALTMSNDSNESRNGAQRIDSAWTEDADDIE